MGGRHGDAELGEDEHGEHGAELNAEATRGGLVRDLVAENHHDVVAHEEQAKAEHEGTVGEHAGVDLRLAVDLARLVHGIHGREGADGVGDVVGPVGEGKEKARRDLEGLVKALGLVEEVVGVRVELGALVAEGINVDVEARGDPAHDGVVPTVVGGVVHGDAVDAGALLEVDGSLLLLAEVAAGNGKAGTEAHALDHAGVALHGHAAHAGVAALHGHAAHGVAGGDRHAHLLGHLHGGLAGEAGHLAGVAGHLLLLGRGGKAPAGGPGLGLGGGDMHALAGGHRVGLLVLAVFMGALLVVAVRALGHAEHVRDGVPGKVLHVDDEAGAPGHEGGKGDEGKGDSNAEDGGDRLLILR
mmetsp:Transcript_2297/g.5805  ORF Transcript_2297/g.5805 Transcript_2297/m.5805 type:complete len:357 (+) Transcript_2297:290-1360(+)